ncbi:T9SS type A sorting domain-containing protein [Reichenbachiella sp.]|uniref:T9SS type A sorting domain-containing protein n=1 Tax=Reichenbachiella sp. TaxID=2184521 RepID=UPI003299E141
MKVILVLICWTLTTWVHSQSLELHFVNANYQTLQGEKISVKQAIGSPSLTLMGNSEIRLVPVLSTGQKETVTQLAYEFPQGEISVYPNPFVSSIRIKTDSYALSEIHILDTKGIEIQHMIYKDEIDLTFLSSGLYYIRLFDDKLEQVTTLKLIKN